MFKKTENTGTVHLAEMLHRALRRILRQKIDIIDIFWVDIAIFTSKNTFLVCNFFQ